MVNDVRLDFVTHYMVRWDVMTLYMDKHKYIGDPKLQIDM